MTDPLRKVRPGDPLRIPASTYNAFVDAALDLRRRQVGSADPRRGPRRAGHMDVVPVRNEQGRKIRTAFVPEKLGFDVVGLDGALILPADNADVFKTDATINSGPGATGRFFSWLAQVQGVHRFDQLGGTQLIGRIDLQLADNHLFPLEQMPIGGRYSVRGYRENSLVRDNGLLSSLEVRIPLYQSIRGEDVVQLAPFLDYGRAWNTAFDTPAPRYLFSAGVGIRWNILPQDRARFEVYWGQQLNHFDTGRGNLQDHGVHVQVTINVL